MRMPSYEWWKSSGSCLEPALLRRAERAVRLALGAMEQAVRLAVVELLLLRIPFERPTELHADPGDQTGRAGAMAGLGVGDGFLAFADRFEPVEMVIPAGAAMEPGP